MPARQVRLPLKAPGARLRDSVKTRQAGSFAAASTAGAACAGTAAGCVSKRSIWSLRWTFLRLGARGDFLAGGASDRGGAAGTGVASASVGAADSSSGAVTGTGSLAGSIGVLAARLFLGWAAFASGELHSL